MLIFITGAAGFIGANLAKRVLTDEPGAHVVGLDNLNDYYDVRLKQARLASSRRSRTSRSSAATLPTSA